MSKTQRIYLLIICLVIISKPCWAEESSLFVAGIPLKIGMPKNEVIKAIQKIYMLRSLDAEKDYWVITTKEVPFEIIGGVNFKDEKVSWVSKYWGSFREEAVDLGKALFSALSERDENVAVIVTRTSRQPRSTTDSIEIRFGKKHIIINVSDSRETGPNVYIQENLDDRYYEE